MASKTLTFIRNSDGDQIWDDASGAYVKYVPPVVKPEQLYAYSKEEGIAMYAWTVESTDVISPEAARTVYTETPILDYSGNNVYMLVDGEYQVVGLSTMESINGIGGEFYVRESNNEYIEMELTGPI